MNDFLYTVRLVCGDSEATVKVRAYEEETAIARAWARARREYIFIAPMAATAASVLQRQEL